MTRDRGAFVGCWSRSHSVMSLRSVTSSGCAGAVSLLPTDGSSISPGMTSGAVTMKITSSTSITSMYGTTLIWLIDLRARRIVIEARRTTLALQDVRELFDERLVSAPRGGRRRACSGCRRRPREWRRRGRWRWRSAPRRCPARRCASVAWLTFARPRNAFMIPHTVPKKHSRN